MAYEEGIATDYNDLLLKLKNFVTKANEVSAPIDPGENNTGQGDVTQPTAIDAALTETWTLTCTIGGGEGVGKFSVHGSISGYKAVATVGEAYDNDIVAFTINDGEPDFVPGDDFQFTVTKIMGEEKWTVKKYATDLEIPDGTDDTISNELILQAPGSEGADEIFVGIQTYYNTEYEYFNWTLNGYTGYSFDPDLGFFNHPGSIYIDRTKCPQVLLDDDSMKYWFVANGRRVIGIMRIGTGIYEPFYLGLMLPYGVPTVIPYPLIVGGAATYYTTIETRRFSTTNNCHRGYMDPYGDGTGFDNKSSLRFWNGDNWYCFRNYAGIYESADNNVWPGVYASSGATGKRDPNFLMQKCESNIDGSYPMFPFILVTTKPTYKNIWGELQGVYAVFGEGVKSEDLITYGGKSYKVFKNCYLENAENYYVLCLE